MTVEGFNPEEFTKTLSKEAIEVLPKDLSEDHKRYIINTFCRFCILAGNALRDDPNSSFTAEQAGVIIQFIGEWTFHKAIDLIKTGVNPQLWDEVLQKVAFAVFETAKQTQANNMPHVQSLEVVENSVKSSFTAAINELAQQGKLDKAPEEITSRSNIDEMAKESVAAQQAAGPKSKEEEDKVLKLASIAIILKKMPESRAKEILKNFDEKTILEIQKYMTVKDIEKKINPQVLESVLKDFKKNLNQSGQSTNDSFKKLSDLIKKLSKKKIDKCLKEERDSIRDFVDSIANKTKTNDEKITPHVSSVIYNYLKTELRA